MTDFPGAAPALSLALTKRGYTKLTPVQESAIDPEYSDKDLLVSAQTGSGKTVAFGLNLAPQLLMGEDKLPRPGAPVALVVAPTRELALQVKRELEWLYAEAGAYIASCVGGMDMREERRNLSRGVHIVVGTPGRLKDHINRGSLDMNDLKAVVLDEADEMLDLGFREELEYILDAAPESRRTLMFSATVPRTIANMAKRYQKDAVRLTIDSDANQHVDIEYRALMVAQSDRENAIINTLRYYEPKNAIVFCGTRATVNHMTSRFNNRGFKVVALSGELSQNERTHALQAMRDGRAQVCIATDVAARGIDLPGLELVIHADIPKTAETLKHRSGRTGRAGNKGVCTIIVPNNARRRTERLLSIAKIQAEWAKPPTANEVLERDNQRILENEVFEDDVKKSEKVLVEQMMELHSPEKIAAALLRRFRSERSAPEELSKTPDYVPSAQAGKGERGKVREDFANGVWFSLSVGRKHKAEPRWLIPMLCGAANFTKAQIGAIKIQTEQTFVEIDPKHVDKLIEGLGPNNTLEKTITVTRLNGVPEFANEAYANREGQSYGDRKGRGRGGRDRDRGGDRGADRGGDRGGERSHGGARDRNDRQGRGGPDRGGKWGDKQAKGTFRKGGKRDGAEDAYSGPYADTPPQARDSDDAFNAGAPKSLDKGGKAKKPHKKKLARAAARAEGAKAPKKRKAKKNKE